MTEPKQTAPDDDRAAFERWLRDVSGLDLVRHIDGSYLSVTTDWAWEACKAALHNERLKAQGLVEALEKLARLGNGEMYGNSDGNMIARQALVSYASAADDRGNGG